MLIGDNAYSLPDDFLNISHLLEQVPYIAMYRKEECLSLFKDIDQHDTESNMNKADKKPVIKWHKVP